VSVCQSSATAPAAGTLTVGTPTVGVLAVGVLAVGAPAAGALAVEEGSTGAPQLVQNRPTPSW
jgi:hypothetical protein